MARPRLDYKVKRTGTSITCYIKGEYVGSFGIKTLCLMAQANRERDAILAKES